MNNYSYFENIAYWIGLLASSGVGIGVLAVMLCLIIWLVIIALQQATAWGLFGWIKGSDSEKGFWGLAKKGATKVDNMLTRPSPTAPKMQMYARVDLFRNEDGSTFADVEIKLPNGDSPPDLLYDTCQDEFLKALGLVVSQEPSVQDAVNNVPKTNPATEKEISTLFPSNKNQNNRRG
jgi:hypothetical protein